MIFELLSGEKVTLREMRDDDLEIMFDWENRPELDYLGNEHQPLTEAQISNFINHSTSDIYTDGQLRLMIDLKEPDASLRGKNDQSSLSEETETEAQFMQSQDEVLAITIGCIDLFEFDQYNQRAGVGILIAETENRNNGYAKEALNLLINYCFEVMNFRQLYCHIPVDNKVSLNLFSSCGFEQSGTNRDWVKKGKVFINAVFMQRLR
jgi:diamine N-acetyltransferase